ncbi:MAG: hypothetical protein KGL39_28100 [Patescibacteria group bacterium]|nr:hypothetical protein [Patescibacteria group bacterium]
MSLYEAAVTKVVYKPKIERRTQYRSAMDANVETESAVTFPLMVSVTYRASERGLPGFDAPLVEDYEFDELKEKATARLAEFERKGAIYLALQRAIKERPLELVKLIGEAKPSDLQDTSVDTTVNLADTAELAPAE